MTTAGDIADGKLSEKMEGEEVLRKVECLRGRLVAERAASRIAKEEAELLETKLIELETRLKEETRSRNRAEKRLKFLMKKLQSLEIFYVSDESKQSSFVDKSEISSVASTSAKEVNSNANSTIQNIQESILEHPPKPSKIVPDADFEQNVWQINALSSCHSLDSPAADEEEINSYAEETTPQKFVTEELREKSSSPDKCYNSSVEEAHNAKSSSQNDEGLNMDKDSFMNCSIKEEILKGGGEQDDVVVDNSTAIVAVDLPKKTEQRIDPLVLDATVKEVLDVLRHAKEKLQTSMERRRTIKVG
ncbi:hypothetical protein ACH5RR_005397 [Cinchona calisaya]|uniref:Uncharacterized protein n=1 Tax=Cinchona calisaya TaxID=153742 RepID=A0ABD3ALB2_9GENT